MDALDDVRRPPFNLALLKYEFLGDKLSRGQLYYRKRGSRNFNIHLIVKTSERWSTNLAFRDYLRSEAKAREEYTRQRLSILNAGSWTLRRYLDAKSGYLDAVVARISEADATGG